MKPWALVTRTTIGTFLFLALVACAAPTVPPRTPTPVAFFTATPSRIATSMPALASATSTRASATAFPPVIPSPTPRPHQFDDVDAGALLDALYPDLKFTPNGDDFIVNGDANWTMWVNSRAEGHFTDDKTPQLAAIIANGSSHTARADAPWGSYLAVFQKREGKLEVAQRSFLFPTEISPLAFDVKIDRATDFDHDDQDELLVTTEATRLNVSSTAGFLYQWNDQQFVELWSAPLGEDNTGAINQTQYFASSSDIHLTDFDGSGMDEIIVTMTRSDYARDSQGLADTDHESARRTERRVYRWGGSAFILDPARTTPLPPIPSPTP